MDIFNVKIEGCKFKGKIAMYSITGDYYWKHTPVELTKGTIHDYTKCKSCKDMLDSKSKELNDIIKLGVGQRNPFPYCCKNHINLLKHKQIKIKDHLKDGEKVARKILFVRNHIKNFIHTDFWYNEISDYYKYVRHSFGQFPKGCGNPLFIEYFDQAIIEAINQIEEPDKRLRLVELIENIDIMKPEATIDLTAAIAIYEKWTNHFPFHFPLFQPLADKYNKSFPIVFSPGRYIKYLNVWEFEPITEKVVLSYLETITDDILKTTSLAFEVDAGNNINLDYYSMKIAVERRKTKAKLGYADQLKEHGYLNMLNQWLEDEKRFIDEVTPIEKALPPQPITKSKPELSQIWLSEPKITVDSFLELGIEKSIWNEQYNIITEKGSVYGTGKSLLGNLFIALKGYAISDNIDYKVAGEVFCSFFNISLDKKVKEPFKAFSSGNEKQIRILKNAFSIK